MKIKEMIYQKDRKIELLYSDVYRGYKFYIMNLGTHPTAYVEIPKGHPLYEVDYNDIYDDIDVHGGLTYSSNHLHISNDEELTGWFIGWDYAHCDDYAGYEIGMPMSICVGGKKWTTEEIDEDCKDVINQIMDIYGGK